MKALLLYLLLGSFIFGCQNSKVSLPKEFVKPEQWEQADRIASVKSLQIPNPDEWNLEKALAIIDSESDLKKLLYTKEWCRMNYQACFPQLLIRLTDTTYVGLTDFFDTMVPGRNNKAQVYGHYGVINEDIYTRAGRASYILNQITGEDFAVVKPNTNYTTLSQFKKAWVFYLQSLKKE